MSRILVGVSATPLRISNLGPSAAPCGATIDSLTPGRVNWFPGNCSQCMLSHADPAGTLGDVLLIAKATVPTKYGDFVAHAYRDTTTGQEHLGYVMGDLNSVTAPLVRLHSECLTGDALGSARCDCGQQLDMALSAIAEEGVGVLVYLRGHEGRGIGLANKIQAYALQDLDGLDTVDANTAQGFPVDARSYDAGALILSDLGLSTVRLMTNNPTKVDSLVSHGFAIVDQIALQTDRTPHNLRYLETKRDRLGHTIG